MCALVDTLGYLYGLLLFLAIDRVKSVFLSAQILVRHIACVCIFWKIGASYSVSVIVRDLFWVFTICLYFEVLLTFEHL